MVSRLSARCFGYTRFPKGDIPEPSRTGVVGQTLTHDVASGRDSQDLASCEGECSFDQDIRDRHREVRRHSDGQGRRVSVSVRSLGGPAAPRRRWSCAPSRAGGVSSALASPATTAIRSTTSQHWLDAGVIKWSDLGVDGYEADILSTAQKIVAENTLDGAADAL